MDFRHALRAEWSFKKSGLYKKCHAKKNFVFSSYVVISFSSCFIRLLHCKYTVVTLGIVSLKNYFSPGYQILSHLMKDCICFCYTFCFVVCIFAFWMIKSALQVLRQFLTTESPLKVMKNVFYFTLKAFCS